MFAARFDPAPNKGLRTFCSLQRDIACVIPQEAHVEAAARIGLHSTHPTLRLD